MEFKTLHKRIPGRHLQIAAYARISNDKEMLETSLREQIEYYTGLILDNPNWDLVGVFYDDGISGTTIEKRNGFKNMLQLANEGHIDIIFVKSISRFARNVIDLLSTIQNLRKLGVEVFFEQQNLSSLDTKCDIALTMFSELAEAEAKSMSANVQWAKHKEMRDGKYYIPVHQMLGYKYDDNGNLYIVEREAKTIRLIFNLYLNDYGTHKIAEYLAEHKIPNKRGMKWHASTVRNILRNEKYVGDVLFQKTYVADVLAHKTYRNHGEEDQYILKNAHPPIIPRALWDAVQKKMDDAIIKYRIPTYDNGKLTRDTSKVSAYASFIKCPYCGCFYQHKLNHYNGKPATRFVVCAKNKGSKLCKSDNYPVDELNAIMAKIIGQIKKDKVNFKKQLLLTFQDTDIDNIKIEISNIQSEISENKSRYRKASLINDEFMAKMKYEYLDNINKLTLKKSKLLHEISVASNPATEANNIIEKLERQPDDPNEIEESPFKMFFKRCVIVNKEFIYFVIGNEELQNPQLNPKNLLYTGIHTYKVRKTEFKTKYGIIINK